MRVAKVATGFLPPISRAHLDEYLVIIMMMITKHIRYNGKRRLNHALHTGC